MNNTTECLFIGGPREGATLQIPDLVNSVFAISAEEAATESESPTQSASLQKDYGYRRIGETNVFAHSSLNDEQVEAIIANETELDDEEEFDDEFEEKLLGIRELVTAALALTQPDSEATPLLFEAIGELNDIL
jgi:hypothetical protein